MNHPRRNPRRFKTLERFPNYARFASMREYHDQLELFRARVYPKYRAAMLTIVTEMDERWHVLVRKHYELPDHDPERRVVFAKVLARQLRDVVALQFVTRIIIGDAFVEGAKVKLWVADGDPKCDVDGLQTHAERYAVALETMIVGEAEYQVRVEVRGGIAMARPLGEAENNEGIARDGSDRMLTLCDELVEIMGDEESWPTGEAVKIDVHLRKVIDATVLCAQGHGLMVSAYWLNELANPLAMSWKPILPIKKLEKIADEQRLLAKRGDPPLKHTLLELEIMHAEGQLSEEGVRELTKRSNAREKARVTRAAKKRAST